MGQALYRRYRSKKLSEIIGQEHITRTLDTAIKRGAFSHAYLLTGPRGVGKTSIARILAHEVNDLPYEGEQTHLDIIEIDAASNRRIDEIRDLREKVHSAPASAKFKVYIIDEVHMLTKEAFNALLKTLEEPPKHVIFILATTDVHKLPDTIISRTQHFTFRPITPQLAAAHLKTIAEQEAIMIDEDAVTLIAEHGGGSFRDSISLLEQAAGLGDRVTLAHVQSMLGIPPDNLVNELIIALQEADTKRVVETLNNLYVQGFLAEQIAKKLAAALRDMLVAHRPLGNIDTSKLLMELLEVPASTNPSNFLEIVLLSQIYNPRPATRLNSMEVAVGSQPDGTPKLTQESGEPKNIENNARKEATSPEDLAEEAAAMKNTAETEKRADDDPKVQLVITPELWDEALLRLKKSHSTLYSVARMAAFASSGSEVTLTFEFPFHKKRMEESKNKQILLSLLQEVCGQPVTLICNMNGKKKAQKKAPEQPKSSTNTSLEAISNIFGDAEMLES